MFEWHQEVVLVVAKFGRVNWILANSGEGNLSSQRLKFVGLYVKQKYGNFNFSLMKFGLYLPRSMFTSAMSLDQPNTLPML